MERFGFNINLKMTPDDIRTVGEAVLGDGTYQAIEVTYYENMEHVDTKGYNDAVKEIADKYHPQVLVHISGFNLAEENSSLRKGILEEIKNCIAYTKWLGGKEIIIHSGDRGAGIHVPVLRPDKVPATAKDVYERAFRLSVEMMQSACDLAKAEGMTLYTENLNGAQLTITTEDLKCYLNAVNRENIKLVFDVGHCYHMEEEIYSEVIAAGNLLHHLHIHDNHGPRKEAWQDEHLPVGEGTIDFQLFIKALQEIQYPGLYMMEFYICTAENLQNSRKTLLSMLESSR